jgi:hypothetical protein
MIDALEQNEGDASRLSDLFAMDHLVTRMRRNSENLLLLAGHESARKWSQPVSLADVVRAATSEIEQYDRVVQRVHLGVLVAGQAVSDVVHLLAEIIENATLFSSRDAPVRVAAEKQTSGGVLIEVADSGVGIPQARLAEMNRRLDDPPVIDVSVSRHMGLFAVAYLAQRHGVRIRLAAGNPSGLTVLIWLPDSVIEREASVRDWPESRQGRPVPATASQYAGAQFRDTQFSGHQFMDDRLTDGRLGDGLPAAGRFAAGQFPGGKPAAAAALPLPAPPASAVRPASAVPPGTAAASASASAASAATLPAPPPGPARRPVPSSAAAAASASASASAASASSGWFGSGGSSGAAAPAAASRAGQALGDPVIGDRTSVGLPVRIPQANRIPSSMGRHGGDSGNEPQPRPERSPERARNRLSGFQRGIRRGTDQLPGAGEEADR